MYRIRAVGRFAAVVTYVAVSSVYVSVAEAQDSEVSGVRADAAGAFDEIVVTAGRRAQPINEVARSVIVVSPDEISENLIKSSNIGDLLGAAVPGFGAPNALDILRTQTLRGRDPQYLIDGVPLTFNGGAGFGGSPLVKFDPEVIGRVEVLYGPTAVYGAGATGGVIQFFTRDATQNDPIEVRLRLQGTTFPGAPNPFGFNALSFKPSIAVSGDLGRFDYLASFSYDQQNGLYDAGGNLANPVFYGFSNDFNYFGKLGFDITDNQRIEGFYSRVKRNDDDRRFVTQFNPDGIATGVEGPAGAAFQYSADNTPIDVKELWNVQYTHDNFFGGALGVQYYGRDEVRISGFLDLRLSAFLPTWPEAWPDNYQSFFLDDGFGVRSQYARDVTDWASVLIGVDYENQDRASDAAVYDLPANFDDTLDVTAPPARVDFFSFPYDVQTLGVFAQVELQMTDRLRISGGVRWEDVSFDIGAGTRIFEREVVNGVQVARPGGQGDNNGVAYNVGVNYEAADWLTVYANFAQGFEVPSLANVSSIVPPDAPLEGSEAAAPQIVDNFELGIRGAAGDFRYSFAGFFSDSELGENFLYDPVTRAGVFNRAPQENYGFEAIIGWRPFAAVDIVSTFSWNDGDFDPDGDGPADKLPLTTLDTQPWKATINGDWDVTDHLALNGQILIVGDRSRAFDEGVDFYSIEGYTVIDVGGSYDLGPGQLGVQITNLFDNRYITPGSQTYLNNLAFLPRVVAAPGRAVSVTFSATF